MAGAVAFVDLGAFADWAKSAGKDLASTDFTVPLKACRLILIGATNANFAGGHDPDGNAWPGLAHARPSSRGSDKPLRDTGLLKASITSAGQGHVEELTPQALVFGTNLEYAAVHQYGDNNVVPKKAKMLSIPLSKDAARAGGARQFPRPLFVLTAKSGKLFLVETKAKGKGKKSKAKLLFHYILVKSVAIPARPYLGIGEKLADRIADVFHDHLIATLDKKAG